MSEIPPLRLSAQDGTFNQIPVFELQLSGGVLTKLSPTKVRLAISGAQGPSGPAGASGFTVPLIIDSGGTGRTVVGSATTIVGINSSSSVYDFYRLVASDNMTLIRSGNNFLFSATTSNISGKQDSLTIPLSIASGGTSRTSAGSAHTLLGVNSDGTTLSYYSILASDNATVVKSGTGIFISATTNAGGSANTAGLVSSSLTLSTTYPLSGGGNLSTNRTFFIMTGAIGQVLITSAGVTGDLIWVNTLGGASGSIYAPTGGFYVVFSGMDVLTNEKVLTAGSSINITTDSTSVFINASTGGGSSVVYAATGNTYVVISNEADLTADRALSASTGLSLTDNGANSTVMLTVNEKIRTRTSGFFAGGNLSTTHPSENSRVYVPFTAQASGVYLALGTSAGGQAVIVNINQWNSTLTASTAMFASANRPQVGAGVNAGSGFTFDIGNVYVGSYLGLQIDQVGSSVSGSDLTVTLIIKTS